MTDSAAVRATVLEILSDVLAEPVDALREAPVLGAHDWDSITSLEALVQLEDRLGVTLDLRTYHDARDVDDLADLVLAARRTNPAPARL